MADNTQLSASTGSGDTIRTEDKGGFKTPVSLIDVGGTGSTSEAIVGDSTNYFPVSIRAIAAGVTLPVSLTTASTVHVAPLTTNSTIHAVVSGSTVSVSPLTTASTIHIAPLTTNSTVSVSGSTVSVSGSTVSVSPLTTASTIHVAQSGTWSLTTATTINVVITAGAGSGGTAAEDDSVFTPTTGQGTPAMGLVTDDLVSTGDVGVFRMLPNRQQIVTLFDSTGNEISVATEFTLGTTGSTGDAGSVMFGYRKDTAVTLVGTTGDLTAPIFDASGQLWVRTSTASTVHIAPLTTASTVHIAPLTTASTVHVAPLTTASTIHANASGSTVAAALVAITSGGCSVFNKVGSTVFETTTIKTSGGSVYGISGYNNTLNPIFVKLYNTTAAPTTSNTAAMRFIIPATTVTGAAGFVEDYGACPVSFTTGIGIRITGGSILDAATEAAASTASQYTVNVRYA